MKFDPPILSRGGLSGRVYVIHAGGRTCRAVARSHAVVWPHCPRLATCAWLQRS